MRGNDLLGKFQKLLNIVIPDKVGPEHTIYADEEAPGREYLQGHEKGILR